MDLATRLATALMRWGSRNSRFGHQDCYTEEFVRARDNQISVAAEREFQDGPGFFLPFRGLLSPTAFAGLDILDLGCGHGGRTIYYLQQGGPRSIVGLEISARRVGVGLDAARRMNCDSRISFLAGLGERLPFADGSFDVIISYDVFEHVQDLPKVMGECDRVLRTGGKLFALFPPYYGPRSHHLDFVTTLPFLHHIFSPGVLVDAANLILEEQPGLRDQPLPPPGRSYSGKLVLPRLNGTTERDFRAIAAAAGFSRLDITLLPFGWGPGGPGKKLVRGLCSIILKCPLPFTRDIFVGTIRCILGK